MVLTEKLIQRAAPAPGKRFRKIADGAGLHLLVRTDGAALRRVWRFEYRLNGKESTLGFGTYPDVTIDEARRRAADARQKLSKGQDPAESNRAARDAVAADAANTFGRVAAEYLQVKMADKSQKTREKNEWLYRCLERLHGRPLSQVETADIVAECRRFEKKGQNETAHRLAGFCARVYRFANRSGYTKHQPAAEIGGKDGALAPVISKARDAITDPQQFGTLMRGIAGLESPTVRHALELLALVATRPGIVHGAEWLEIDLDKAQWIVPAQRMKMRKPHTIMLSRQAVAILKRQHDISGRSRYVFPQARTDKRAMSNGTLQAALAKLGYNKRDEWLNGVAHSSHGFRSSFSTIMNGAGADPRIIELCLAHGNPDRIAAIYNRAEFEPERRALMQQWADLIDELRGQKEGATQRRL